MRHPEDGPPSLWGRFIGAAMAMVFAMLTSVAIPWFLAWKFPVKLGLLFPMLKVFAFYGFYFWIALVGIFAMTIGYLYGGEAILDVFNLVWKTGETNDKEAKEAAEMMRLIIPATMIVSAFLIVSMRV